MTGASKMDWIHRSTSLPIYISVVILIISGCATLTNPYWEKTAYGTWSLSQEEVSRLSTMSRQNILSSASENDDQRVQIFVTSRKLDGKAKVKRLAGQEGVYVVDVRGQQVKINVDQITGIQSLREIKNTPHKKTTDKTAEELSEAALYAPLVPVAIISWPFLKAMGLDAGKNAEDGEKAQLAYGGMSRDDLATYVGEPLEKYHCKSKYGSNEVWIYQNDHVLRGGRALFINLEDGKVYHTSHDTTFFKDSCSLLKTMP